jgi:hypothetical protein
MHSYFVFHHFADKEYSSFGQANFMQMEDRDGWMHIPQKNNRNSGDKKDGA